MTLIGSDFTEKTYGISKTCSECLRRFPPDHVWLVSIRNGRVRKRVCSEECRMKFDDEY